MSLFEDLRAAVDTEWREYTQHEFLQQLGAGTLPLGVFQDYLVQDYLFLVQYARANALAAYKSRTLDEIRSASESLQATIHETDLHRRLMTSWGIPVEQYAGASEKQATIAYTRYVLDSGMSGDLLDMHVALAPCAIGYAEIGTALAPARREQPQHPYGDWIDEYAGEAFQREARIASARLDALAGDGISPQRFDALVTVFRNATRLEADFWQQALDTAQG